MGRYAIALAVGFLGAQPFAEASGLRSVLGSGPDGPAVVIVAGLILFFLILSLSGSTVRLVHGATEALKRVEDRPPPSFSLGMLILGTFAALTSMYVAYNATRPTATGASIDLNNGAIRQGVQVQSSGSLGLMVLAFLTFFLGAMMVGLSLWSTLKPVPRTVALAKPDAPNSPNFAPELGMVPLRGLDLEPAPPRGDRGRVP